MRLDLPHALTLRYLVVLLVLAVLSLMAFLALSYVIFSGGQLSDFIRITDEEQLSSQQIAYFSLRLAQEKSPVERANWRSQLEAGIRTLGEQEDSLVTTLHMVTRTSPELGKIYFEGGHPMHQAVLE